MDVVVFDEVAEGVGDEDADGAEVGESDVVDVVVEDGDAAGGEGGVVVDGGAADADAGHGSGCVRCGCWSSRRRLRVRTSRRR